MKKKELKLSQLFEDNYDFYSRFSKKLVEQKVMTKDKFVKVVSDLLTELEANHHNKQGLESRVELTATQKQCIAAENYANRSSSRER